MIYINVRTKLDSIIISVWLLRILNVYYFLRHSRSSIVFGINQKMVLIRKISETTNLSMKCLLVTNFK